MNPRNDIDAEWIELAPVLAGSGFMPTPYRVPDGYFQGFFDRLMMHIRTEESGGLKTGLGSSRSANQEDSEYITATAEIESISPLLAGLSRKTPYQVPENYFAQFRVTEERLTEERVADERVADEKTASSPAPVIRMNRGRSWMRIAVAAAVTAVILSGAFFYLRPTQTSVTGDLAKVSDQDMVNYMMSEDLPVENASDSGASQLSATAPQPFNDYEISDLMSNVTDNELEDYASNDDGPDSNLN